jgi:hypothetical protein
MEATMRNLVGVIGFAIVLASPTFASAATQDTSPTGAAIAPASRSDGVVVAAMTGMAPKGHPMHHHHKHKYRMPKSHHTR